MRLARGARAKEREGGGGQREGEGGGGDAQATTTYTFRTVEGGGALNAPPTPKHPSCARKAPHTMRN